MTFWLVFRFNIVFMSKKLAILGCGYLGSGLAREALERGWTVSALPRNADTAASLREAGVSHVVEAELDGISWHEEIDSTQDFVVNCVGAASADLAGYAKSYVEGQDSVMQWASNGQVGTYVFTSSSSVYPQTGRRLVDETASCDGVSERGGLLLAAEKLGFPGVDSIDRSFVLRLAGLYGPDRHLLLDNVRTSEPLAGNGDRILNLIHRDDAISAILLALDAVETNVGRIYNVSDGNHASRSEIVEWLAEKLSVEVPAFSGDDEDDVPNRKVSNDRIRDELGWTPAYSSYRNGYEAILAARD